MFFIMTGTDGLSAHVVMLPHSDKNMNDKRHLGFTE
jgi:hypothetical protein